MLSRSDSGVQHRAILEVVPRTSWPAPIPWSSCIAHAQQLLRFDQKYIESAKSSSGVTPVAVDSFGDILDLSSGSVQFRWVKRSVMGEKATIKSHNISVDKKGNVILTPVKKGGEVIETGYKMKDLPKDFPKDR